MKLSDLGFSIEFQQIFLSGNWTHLEPARVMAVHKERYVVMNEKGEFEAEVTGNFRYSTNDQSHFPTVGDWVAIMSYEHNFGLIHHVFSRHSRLERQSVGRFGEKQLIAANVDFGCIIQSIDRDFNLNRLDRYIAVCQTGNIAPVILLSKIDLSIPAELEKNLSAIASRHPEVKVFPFSNSSLVGLNDIQEFLQKSKTYCFLGSSGVGKSTLLNNLLKEEIMKTNVISQSSHKGKHTTSHRELFVLDSGALIIDTPGMREIGLTDFHDHSQAQLEKLSLQCKYTNCSHEHEDGCAYLAALDEKLITPEAYENFLKLKKEAQYFQSSSAEKRKKDKALGKYYKQVIKDKKRLKY